MGWLWTPHVSLSTFGPPGERQLLNIAFFKPSRCSPAWRRNTALMNNGCTLPIQEPGAPLWKTCRECSRDGKRKPTRASKGDPGVGCSKVIATRTGLIITATDLAFGRSCAPESRVVARQTQRG